MFKFWKNNKVPRLTMERFPSKERANLWMKEKVEYYAAYKPSELATLFSPACGDYLPIGVHVGSVWTVQNENFYRELKLKYPEAVSKARVITEGLAGRISLSRIGDPTDYVY